MLSVQNTRPQNAAQVAQGNKQFREPLIATRIQHADGRGVDLNARIVEEFGRLQGCARRANEVVSNVNRADGTKSYGGKVIGSRGIPQLFVLVDRR